MRVVNPPAGGRPLIVTSFLIRNPDHLHEDTAPAGGGSAAAAGGRDPEAARLQSRGGYQGSTYTKLARFFCKRKAMG